VTTAYPTGIDLFTTKVSGAPVGSAHVNDLQDAVEAIQETLGTSPQGAAASVKARIAAVETTAGAAASSATVTALDGRVTTVETVAAAAATAASVTALLPRLEPAGGSTGQVLTKSSATDYDTAWTTVSGGSGDAPPGWVSNRYYGNSPAANSSSTGALNSLYVAPIYIPNSIAIDSLTFEVTVAAGVGGVVRLGVYTMGADGLPGTLVCETPTISTTSTGIKTGAVSSTIPAAGWYWVGGVPQVAACTYRTVSAWHPFAYSGLSAPSTNMIHAGYLSVDAANSATTVTGALPAAFTAPGMTPFRAALTSAPPRIFIHTT
jgi:hypothetical protein